MSTSPAVPSPALPPVHTLLTWWLTSMDEVRSAGAKRSIDLLLEGRDWTLLFPNQALIRLTFGIGEHADLRSVLFHLSTKEYPDALQFVLSPPLFPGTWTGWVGGVDWEKVNRISSAGWQPQT